MTNDKKPYGIKRQWHLLPFRQLAILNPGDAIYLALANYQEDPCESTAADLYAAVRVKFHQSGFRGDHELERLAVDVLQQGNTKYGPDNWKQATSKNEYVSAFCRHVFEGSEFDLDSGLPHLAHAACNAMFLMWMERNGL